MTIDTTTAPAADADTPAGGESEAPAAAPILVPPRLMAHYRRGAERRRRTMLSRVRFALRSAVTRTGLVAPGSDTNTSSALARRSPLKCP